MSLAAGEVYWAIVPYTPATPLKIHVADGAPVEVPSASQIVDGLPPERFPDLAEDSAAMVTAPIRLHETAVDTRKSLGRLDRDEMRALVERFVSYWQFDLRQLLVDQIRELQRRREAR